MEIIYLAIAAVYAAFGIKQGNPVHIALTLGAIWPVFFFTGIISAFTRSESKTSNPMADKESAADIAQLVSDTSQKIIQATSQHPDMLDYIDKHIKIMACLASFTRALREVYGVRIQSGSLADVYSNTLSDHGHQYDVHDYIVGELLKKSTQTHYADVLFGFLQKPMPIFERRRAGAVDTWPEFQSGGKETGYRAEC